MNVPLHRSLSVCCDKVYQYAAPIGAMFPYAILLINIYACVGTRVPAL